MDMTAVKLANPPVANQWSDDRVFCPVTRSFLQCNVSGPTSVGSVTVRAHLVGNPALLQAALRQPCVGVLDGTLDMIGRSREVIWRSDQRAQRRNHEVFDGGVEAFQFAHQLPRDQ